jgi:hypothetical protein
MGSSFRAAVIEPWDRKPKGARVHAAGPVTSALIEYTIKNVLLKEPHGERECYVVSRDLRNSERALGWEIRPLIMGGNLGYPLTLIDKIVMIFIDHVNLEIIRPGPTPEDRVISDIAEEMREFGTRFESVVRAIIAVDDEETKIA